MKISLCMIVKDDSELSILERCLDSIQNYVDGVYLTVTRPNQKGIEAMSKRRGVHLSEFKWEMGTEPWKNWDFSAARNFNFAQAPKSDWILWLDSDDIFVGGEYLRDVAETALEAKKDTVFFSYWYSCNFEGEPSMENLRSIDLEHLRERLIKPDKIVWKGRLHETPIPKENVKIDYSMYSYDVNSRPIAVMHGITDKQGLDRLERNRIILELQLEGEGDNPDPRTLLYLMKIYGEMDGDYLDKCLEYGQIYVEKSGWAEEIGVAYELMGNVWGKKGDNVKASEMYLKGIGVWPHQPMTYLRLAQALFNSKKYRECRHWLEIGMGLKMDNGSTMMNNYGAMKALASELLLKLSFQVEKNTKKALEAARLLQMSNPTPEHEANVEHLENLDRLNDACKNTDELTQYLEDIGETSTVVSVLDTLPGAINTQPFAIKARQRNVTPRVWGDKEICYFANFGGPHINHWDGNSLSKGVEGVAGSETAVVRMSENWVKQGYKVAVYGDPERPITINGVVYLPWYWFNPKDTFNIFIQWRGWGLAQQIKCKKFLVDLHDVFNGIDMGKKDLKKIDKIMVKSKFHRDLAPNVPDSKFKVISNGIDL